MSRIRSIHPGIWTDEAFMSLSAHGRLLLMGLWTEAFDDGVFDWKPLTIKARIFPVDSVDVDELLNDLLSSGLIKRINDHPKQPGAIRNFQKYQRPKKPNSSGMLTEGYRSFVGAGGNQVTSQDADPEPVPHQFPTSTEKPPQMEDGGGKMEEKAASQPRADDLLDRLLEAAGIRGNPNPSLAFPGEILALIEAGFDVEREILPAIRARPNPNARIWAYFVPQIRDYANRIRGIVAEKAPESTGPKAPPVSEWPVEKWRQALEFCRMRHEWQDVYGPPPFEEGCMVPRELWIERDREFSRQAA